MAISSPPTAPILELRDPLGEFLGAVQPGEAYRYTYEDAVKLSGHSCPTVAGAWLVTAAALRGLYGAETPVRGEIEVVVGGSPGDGSAGPMAQVISMVTGAAPETGFNGLMGRWRRRDLLRFDPALAGRFRFRRIDTGRTVEIACTPASVPPSPEMPELFAASLSGRATSEERLRFASLWQARVEDILTGDPGRVIELRILSS